MRTFIFAGFLTLAACGSKSSPAPTTPEPTGETATDPTTNACNPEGENGTPTTMEQCQCMGFEAVGDIGDGQVKCPDGLTEVSKIRYGIEGGVCCAKGEPGVQAS